MTKLTSALLAIALSVPGIALAQNSQQTDKNTQEHNNEAAQNTVMGQNSEVRQTMSGMVSNNGKTLTSGDKSYIVKNPGSLKSYDSQTVSVVYQYDPDHNSIHVVSVTPAQ